MDPKEIRKDFPIFQKNPWLIYFDNAATSQKPKEVIESINEFYESYNSNVHRGIHKLSEKATDEYEKAREKIAKFINAKPEEIVFTKNSTEALNLIAYSLRKKVKRVKATIAEHHSNFVPWQQLYDFEVIDVEENGDLKPFEKDADLYAITHASNVLGNIYDVKSFREEVNGYVVVDASQSAPHIKLDVKKLDIDFLCFTGHKMLGPTGIGVLYIKEGNEKDMLPFLYGGDMIIDVHINKTEFAGMPSYFEAGTPNIAQAISLGKAIDYLNRIGMDEIRKHELTLIKKAMEIMDELEISYLGTKDPEKRTGLISFIMENAHPHDIATLLDKKGIAVRAGMHCAHPLHRRFGLNASTRASFYLYNTSEELDAFREALEEVKNVFG